MPAGPQANAWSAQASYSGTSSVTKPRLADRAVVGRDDVLDLVRQQRRRIDVARVRRAEEERHLAAVADRLVGEGADAGHAQAAGDQQEVPRSRIDLERPAERAEHVDRIAWPQRG